jgi:hypothetical protein
LNGGGGENEMALGMAKYVTIYYGSVLTPRKAQEGGEMSEAEKKESIELQTTVKLNLAACLLKVDKPGRAIEELNWVLPNPTALYFYFFFQAHHSFLGY